MTVIDTTAKNAYGNAFSSPSSAGSVITRAAMVTKITAQVGTPVFGFTRRRWRDHGRPLSRENANVIRDALVTQAIPQNSWPTVEMTTTAFSAQESRELLKMASDDPAPSLTAPTSVAANVIARSTNQPITADQKTDCQTPRAAPIAAPRVSSETCAEASKPVIVYCVSRKPSGST